MPVPTLKPLPPARFDFWAARHLLSRAGFGGTPEQVRGLANLGLDDAVEVIIDDPASPAEAIAADLFDHDIMRPPTPEERRAARAARASGDEAAVERFRSERQRRQREDRRQMARFQEWWLQRMIETPRPLEEKMTLFWHGHFATGYRAIEDSYHMFRQNQLFRRHATGSFKALSHAIIHDPAMLRYLNNDRNRRQMPNENLARELMELFTLGEGNAYTEQDIKEGARALTGYGVDDDAFVFRRRQHDPGPKRILGREGEWDGDDLVDILLGSNYASEFMTLKLYRFFVNDLPDGPDAPTRRFLGRLAQRYRQTDYDTGVLLRTLFRSEHFYDAVHRGAQIKSPTQLVVQAIRSLRTPVRSLRTLVQAGGVMGQHLGQPPSVKGWEGGRSWINTSTLFARQNVLVYLLTGREAESYAWERDGDRYEAGRLLTHLPDAQTGATPRDTMLYLLRFHLAIDPHPDRVATLERHLGAGRLDDETLVGLLSLMTAMPEYQLC